MSQILTIRAISSEQVRYAEVARVRMWRVWCLLEQSCRLCRDENVLHAIGHKHTYRILEFGLTSALSCSRVLSCLRLGGSAPRLLGDVARGGALADHAHREQAPVPEIEASVVLCVCCRVKDQDTWIPCEHPRTPYSQFASQDVRPTS